MSDPVANWRQDVGRTAVFWDAIDRDLRLYGPQSVWRDIHRQSIGPATILTGVVSFGYLPDEIAALSQHFAGKRLAPLIASNIANRAKLAVQVEAPNKVSLTLTPSIPFPDLRLSATVQDAGLADQIETGWRARTVITGKVDFTYDMRTAVGGYQVTVDFRSTAEWLSHQAGASDGLTGSEGTALVTQFVRTNDANLIRFIGLNDEPAAHRLVGARLAEILFKGTFFQNGYLMIFDNGEQLGRWDVRDARTLVQPTTQLFIHTERTSNTISLGLT